MGRITHTCKNAWVCCPGWFRFLTVFWIANILGDLVAFPFVHTFWNLLDFEGWYID